MKALGIIGAIIIGGFVLVMAISLAYELFLFVVRSAADILRALIRIADKHDFERWQ